MIAIFMCIIYPLQFQVAAAPGGTFRIALEDGLGFLLTEAGSYILQEAAP